MAALGGACSAQTDAGPTASAEAQQTPGASGGGLNDVGLGAATVMDRITQVLVRERPGILVGSVLGDGPWDPPTVYIKGPADAYIRDLVASASIEVIVADNQPFSFEELEARTARVHEALMALGFTQVSSSADITRGGVVESTVFPEPALPADREAILAALPDDVREMVQLTVSEEPVVEPGG